MGRGPSIEGRKNAEDARRAKLFTRLIREMTVAARLGGADPVGNPRLRVAIERALATNMPRRTIERAIKPCAPGGHGSEAIRYEGYGPAGVALIVDCFTDNPMRTVAGVRHTLNRCGGHLGTSGSVAFAFSRCGELVFSTHGDPVIEERLLDVALMAGVDDVIHEQDQSTVLCTVEAFETVRQVLAMAGWTPTHEGVGMRPKHRVTVPDSATEADLIALLARLEGMDDVSGIYHNARLPLRLS